MAAPVKAASRSKDSSNDDTKGQKPCEGPPQDHSRGGPDPPRSDTGWHADERTDIHPGQPMAADGHAEATAIASQRAVFVFDGRRARHDLPEPGSGDSGAARGQRPVECGGGPLGDFDEEVPQVRVVCGLTGLLAGAVKDLFSGSS